MLPYKEILHVRSMKTSSPHTILYSFLYGGASVLLAIDIFFFVRSLFIGSFVSLIPVGAGILLTVALLLILYAEGRARGDDRREHRRLSRVASQLEHPLASLEEDIAYLVKESKHFPPEVRLKLKRMNTKAQTIMENVRDVFLMLRAQGGRVSQELRVYDACALAEEAIQKVKPLASARNVEIIQKAHCVNAPVTVDRGLFIIALVHLLENGVLYTLTPGLVNVAIMRGSKSVRIVVQDRGIGIKPEDVHAIFDPFVRGKHAGQYDPDGIGVGLTLSRLIISEFGGKLTWRQRSESSGLEFEIKLPLAGKK